MKPHILEQKSKVHKVLLLLPVLYINLFFFFRTTNNYLITFAVLCTVGCLVIAAGYVRARKIAQSDGSTLKINGIFSSLSVGATEVSSIAVKKDLLCYVFDLRKVAINDKSVYTIDFDMEEFRRFIAQWQN